MKESDIRPKEIFEEYIRLCKEDSDYFFSDVEKKNILCPACNVEGKESVIKNGFKYDECQSCYTLYVNPRPSAKVFEDFYNHSKSSKYWATTFYKTTENSRRENLWKPKAQNIKRIASKYKLSDFQAIDIGGGYGTFAEELSKIISNPVIIVEPAPHLAKICREKNLKVIEKFLENIEHEDLSNRRSLFLSFELFEHLHSPNLFLKKLYNLMKPKDLFYFTTLSSIGVDIQSLWNNSKSITPPQHLNFFNPNSIKILLEKNDFTLLEVNTPGKLDIDILFNQKESIQDKFWKTFINTSSADQKEKMQKFISEIGYSSHMEIICTKN